MADKDITISQVSAILEDSFICVEDRRDEFELPALNELEGAMKLRIHTDGLDSDGVRIGLKSKNKGRYSKGYEKKKRDGGIINGQRFAGAGANLYPINLFLFGDLSRGYTTGKLGGDSVLAFANNTQRDKAAYGEINYNTVVFKPTESELEGMIEVLILGLDAVLKDCF